MAWGEPQSLGNVLDPLLALKIIEFAESRALTVDAVDLPDQGGGRGVQFIQITAAVVVAQVE